MPCPHARNDCGMRRERDAGVQVLSIGVQDCAPAGKRPLLLCQGCLGAYAALRVIHLSGPGLDQPVAVMVTVARAGGRDGRHVRAAAGRARAEIRAAGTRPSR